MKKNIIQFITLLVINELFANKGILKNQKTILLIPRRWDDWKDWL